MKDREVLIGSLIRVAGQVVTAERARWAAREGHEITSAHASLMQPLFELGGAARITTLAKRASITKQSMSALVDEVEKRGYVARTPDPDDARATLVQLTAKGTSYVKDARQAGHALEKDWERRVGKQRIAEMKATLLLLRESWLAEENAP